MKESDIEYKLIAKELASDMQGKEPEELQKIFAADKNLNKNYHTIKNFWLNYFPVQQSHNIIEKTEKKLGFAYEKNSRYKISRIYKIAAVFFFLLSVGLASWFYLQPEDNLILKEYTCGAGEVKKIVLSDGTKMWLNNMSVLITVEPFEDDSRRVKLIGEAYFEVEPDAGKPFIVETRNLQTTVLGTKFNIVAYPGTEEQEIELYHGKVKLAPLINTGKELHLNPGEKARFSENQNEINVSAIEATKPAAWRNGLLSFSNEELYSIANTLERKFETPVYIGDQQTGKLRFTAEFEEEPLEKILRLLKEAKAFNYEITDDGVFISSVK